MPKAKQDSDVQGSMAWNCLVPNCGESFNTEGEMNKHLGQVHRIWGRQGGSNIIKEGTELEQTKPEINEAGFLVEPPKPLDPMNALRRILANNGVRDRRESIVDLMEYEDIHDLDALRSFLALAEVSPRRQDLIVTLWSKYVNQLEGKQVDSAQTAQEAVKKKMQKSPIDITASDMMDWTPSDYGQYMVQMRKYMQAQQFQNQIFEMMYSSMGMGGGLGHKDERPAQKVPPEIQAQLDRLKTLEEQNKLKEAVEPILKELRYMRAEKDEDKNKSNPFQDLLEMAKMKEMMKTFNSKEGEEYMRLQMEERLEKLRIDSQREMREQQSKQEILKNENQVLQLKAMESAFGAKLDTLKTQLDVAQQSKKDDLISVIKQAQDITNAMKNISGDQESAEDKKMKAISEIIHSAAETLKPVAAAIGEGMMNKNRGPPSPYGRQVPSPPPTVRTPPPGQQAMVTCTTPGCGADFPVDPTQAICECPSCHARYELQPAGYTSGGMAMPGMPNLGSNPGNIDARKQALMGLPEQELIAASEQMGLNPRLYPSKEQLIDEMLRMRFNV